MKKRALQLVELPGDVVLAVELVLGEHAQEDVLGEDVLEQHLAHVGGGHVRADGVATQLEEADGGGLVLGVVRLGGLHRLAQVGDDGGKVGLELRLGAAELLYLRQLVVEEAADEPVERAGLVHVHPHGLFAVLDQHRRAGVLEDDVVARVAGVELALDLAVEVVARVLGLPVAAGHAQGVLHRAVGPDAAHAQLGHERELFLVGGAVRGQAVLERGPDVQLAVGAAGLDQPGQLLAVAVYVRVGWHGGAYVRLRLRSTREV